MTTTASNTLAALRLRLLASVATMPASARPKPSLPSHGVHWGTIKIRGPKPVKSIPNPPMSGPCTGLSSAKLNIAEAASIVDSPKPAFVWGSRASNREQARSLAEPELEANRAEHAYVGELWHDQTRR